MYARARALDALQELHIRVLIYHFYSVINICLVNMNCFPLMVIAYLPNCGVNVMGRVQ